VIVEIDVIYNYASIHVLPNCAYWLNFNYLVSRIARSFICSRARLMHIVDAPGSSCEDGRIGETEFYYGERIRRKYGTYIVCMRAVDRIHFGHLCLLKQSGTNHRISYRIDLPHMY